MKTFFAILAIFICPTFAFGDTIGPSTGRANSANVGDTYKLNLINYPGDQLAVDSIFGVADFSDRTANLITGQGDPLALNSKILITRTRLRHADAGVHEWSGSTFGYAVRGESSESAAHVWKSLLTTHKSSLSEDQDESDQFARNTIDDFDRYAASFARPTWFDERKASSDDNRNKNKDDDGKSGSGKNAENGDNGHRGKPGGDDGKKGGGDNGDDGGGKDGGNGGDDGHTREIPEPSSLIMLGTGLLIGGSVLRKFAA